MSAMVTRTKETALEDRGEDGARLFSPSAARNRDAIRDAFLKYLPETGAVLEIGSGTGEHAVHIARAAPGLSWFTSDPDAAARASIAAHIDAAALGNLEGPLALDVAQDNWHAPLKAPLGAVVSINMIHIAPFEAAKGLFAGASALLRPGGRLVMYGPFSQGGVHSAPSNEAFDASLKARDPRWGVRDLEHDLAPLAQEHAFALRAIVQMPASNFTVVFEKE